MNLEENKTVTILSLSDDVGVDTETYATTITNVRVHHQPSDDSFSVDLDESYGKDSIMILRPQSIKQDDKIIDNDNSDAYMVRVIRSFDFLNQTVMELRVRSIIN